MMNNDLMEFQPNIYIYIHLSNVSLINAEVL